MQADIDEIIHVHFTGKMVDLSLEINQNMYGPFAVKEGREMIMYVKLLKVLYGTIQAAQLIWE
jgi:hypothetical protein